MHYFTSTFEVFFPDLTRYMPEGSEIVKSDSSEMATFLPVISRMEVRDDALRMVKVPYPLVTDMVLSGVDTRFSTPLTSFEHTTT